MAHSTDGTQTGHPARTCASPQEGPVSVQPVEDPSARPYSDYLTHLDECPRCSISARPACDEGKKLRLAWKAAAR